MRANLRLMPRLHRASDILRTTGEVVTAAIAIATAVQELKMLLTKSKQTQSQTDDLDLEVLRRQLADKVSAEVPREQIEKILRELLVEYAASGAPAPPPAN